MTMNSSGPISLAGTTAGQSIEIENGGNGTTTISLNDAAVRSLAGVPSGAITMPTNFYGKANRVSISYTFTGSTANASLNASAISGYSAGKSDITITINSGVYLYATSTGSYGFSLSGATTGDTITLVNNGYIMGQGANGASVQGNGGTGGPAFNITTGTSVVINNGSGYIGGGGGGGAGSGQGSGGGAGGGAGGEGNHGGGCCYHCCVAGGVGGGIGSSGGNPTNVGCASGGGGGGRIMPGTGGAGGTNGNCHWGRGGGAGGGGSGGCGSGGHGGNGGSAGAAGQNGTGNGSGAGGGGGYGASGGTANPYGGAAGGGGKAINKNGVTVTFSSGCTRVYGAVS